MFLDADDWVEADMLESLYRLAEADHADVACCLLREENQLEEKDNCTITERTIIHGKNKTESGLALLTVWGPVCKLYRKDLIENIQFEEYKVAEDLLFNTNVVCSEISRKTLHVSNSMEKTVYFHMLDNITSKLRPDTK